MSHIMTSFKTSSKYSSTMCT